MAAKNPRIRIRTDSEKSADSVADSESVTTLASNAHSIQTTVYIKPQRTVSKKINCHPTQDFARKLTTIGILWF